MTYQADTVAPSDVHNIKRDEITIFQENKHGYTSIVFKGYLKAGGKTSVFYFCSSIID